MLKLVGTWHEDPQLEVRLRSISWASWDYVLIEGMSLNDQERSKYFSPGSEASIIGNIDPSETNLIFLDEDADLLRRVEDSSQEIIEEWKIRWQIIRRGGNISGKEDAHALIYQMVQSFDEESFHYDLFNGNLSELELELKDFVQERTSILSESVIEKVLSHFPTWSYYLKYRASELIEIKGQQQREQNWVQKLNDLPVSESDILVIAGMGHLIDADFTFYNKIDVRFDNISRTTLDNF
jgi:hypothetical protein